MGDRQQLQFEAVLFGKRLEHRDRLLAVGRIVINIGDLLALQLVPAAKQIGEILDLDVAGVPVGAEDREGPADDVAVGALGATIAAGQERDLVGLSLVHQRIGDPGRQWHEQARAGRAFALEALVAFDAAVRGVAGFALLGGDLDPIDAAVARVQQVQVIGKTVGERDPVRRVGAGAIDERGDELLVLRQSRHRGDSDGHREQHQ